MEILEGILLLLAGSGVFLTGMKLMSDGLEGSAGKGIRKLFNKISNKRLPSIGIGAGVTAIIQSSAATTVMVIGFVNAGIMTLFQATAIIMGANIGTTVTGLLVSLSAFPIKSFVSALALAGVFMMMFSKNNTVKNIGSIIAGLGLIFVGLSLMSGALEFEEINSAFTKLFTSIKFPLLLILFGLVFTALIQSSSAATGLIITMVMDPGGILPVGSALYIVLGTNIGTCITAILASMGASQNAKRAALIHLIFNLIGTVIFTIVMVFTSKYIVKLLGILAPGVPGMQIAYFHVFFNVITTLILMPFIKQLVFLATKIIRDKKDDADTLKLYYIDDRILQTPPIAVAQVLKEVLNMSELSRLNLDRAYHALVNYDLSEKNIILKEEQKIDFINKGVGKYLVKMASLKLPGSDEKLVGSLHHVIADIERIGDHAINFLGEAEAMKESSDKFSEAAKLELDEMYEKITEMYRRTIKIFEYRDTSNLNVIDSLEEEIDGLKIKLEHSHVTRLNNGECTVESGKSFYAVISALERIADHLNNIAYSVKKSKPSSPSVPKKTVKGKVKKIG